MSTPKLDKQKGGTKQEDADQGRLCKNALIQIQEEMQRRKFVAKYPTLSRPKLTLNSNPTTRAPDPIPRTTHTHNQP